MTFGDLLELAEAPEATRVTANLGDALRALAPSRVARSQAGSHLTFDGLALEQLQDFGLGQNLWP